MIEIIITENEQNQRLDRFLRKYLPKAPLSHIYKIIRKDVKVNNKRAGIEAVLQAGDVVALYLGHDIFEKYSEKEQVKTARRQFAISYEDENMLIADKPRGLLTHGDKTEKKNTLVNQVIGYLIAKGDYVPQREKTFSPAAVNRLDRNTSGLVIFGKNFQSTQALNRMISKHSSVKKLYLAACFGEIHNELHLKSAMEKEEGKNRVRLKSEISSHGKIIQTIIRPIELKNGCTLAEAELLTGRTHQIRAHLLLAGFPIIADPKYGDLKKNELIAKKFGLNTQFLHAYKLKFENCEEPLSYMNGKEVFSELPRNLKECWEQL